MKDKTDPMFRSVYFILLLVLLASCGKEEAQPNILFILADDQCYNTIHELGNREVITPTLDELARNGTIFTTCYNMGGWNGAICIASRTMFNTGKMLWRAQQVDSRKDLDSLAQQGELWSKEMARLGYDTYMTGKWHVKISPEEIFHQAGTERPGMPKDRPEGYNRPLSETDTIWRPWDRSMGGFWEGGTHWSEVVANETLDFLEQSAKSSNPFFMYVAFNAPHDPRQSPREYVDMYPLEQVSVPGSFLPEYPQKDDIGCSASLRDEALAPFPRTEYAVRVNRQEYYAIITHMDAQIRRILDKLEETGQADNTYIFYSADHGLSVGHHGLIGKQNMYEHSLRPPLIVLGPDVPKAKKQKAPVYLQDIMATALEYAGGEVPSWVEFHSLKPFIDGKRSATYYPAVYGAYVDLQRMIREDKYKLIVYPEAGVLKLFNLETDPEEVRNLAGEPGQLERVRDLFAKLEDLQQEMGDTLRLRDYSFELIP